MNILKQDYITNLPMNIKEEVLMKLPIKEAVRTSLLSTKWKYAWMSVPNLVFIEDYAESTLIRLVDEVLSVHRGPILQFKLVSRHACNEAIDRWMLILSKNGINNFHIQIQYSIGYPVENYMIPSSSSFFSCLALEHVHIFLSTIHVPPSFLGFKFLRTLRLLQFNLTGIDVSKLISSCPLLEILELYCFDNYGHLVIRAPNLKWLSIEGDVVDISFETPKLHYAKIYLGVVNGSANLPSKNCRSNISRILGSLSVIEELHLYSLFITYLAKGPILEVLPIPFYRLTELYINFHEICKEGVAVLFCLFRSAPNLKVLSLELFDPSSLALRFWEAKGIESNLFNCLEIVNIILVEYCESTVEVAKFVLSTAPVLKKLVIREIKVIDDDDDDDNIMDGITLLNKLASFPKLSKMAKIVFF
ncbi:F-box/FBD/LRR-repeat protein At1g13570-like [Carex rostrata]